MAISRIDLADAGSPNKLMMAFLKAEPNLSIPVRVEEYCSQLGILEIRSLDTDNFEGGLITTSEKNEGFVLVKRGVGHERRRFTIAHELGHFLMPSHKPPTDGRFLCSREDFNQASLKAENVRIRMESEANRFAALFLMPPPFFRKDASNDSDPTIENILEVARKYETSKEATARLYIDYREEPCAVILAKDGCIVRYHKNGKFPFILPRYGDRLPVDTSRSLVDGREGSPSNVRSIDAGDWIDIRVGAPKKQMRVQNLKQSQGYSLTLLVMDYRDEDEEYEEELIERSWSQPTFRKR